MLSNIPSVCLVGCSASHKTNRAYSELKFRKNAQEKKFIKEKAEFVNPRRAQIMLIEPEFGCEFSLSPFVPILFLR